MQMKENVPITDPVWMVDPNWLQKTGGYARDMTLRDHYAGLAMQSILGENVRNLDYVAIDAYNMADAMLKARDAK
jgi:hypothetical protein